MTLTSEGSPVFVEDVDRGEQERADDDIAMSEILSAAITEKVESGVASSGLDDIAAAFASGEDAAAGEE